MKFNLNLKLSPNLHIAGDRILSYDTHVANIHFDSSSSPSTHNKIVAFGKYSRTTGKHIARVATLLGVPIEYINEDRPAFFKYMQGVVCNPVDNYLSPQIASMLLSNFRNQQGFVDALISYHERGQSLKRSDWRILCRYWGIPEDSPKPFSKELQWG